MSYTDSYAAGEMRSEREARAQLGEVKLWLKKIEKAKNCEKRKAWMKDAKNSVAMFEAGELTSNLDTTEQLSGANVWHANNETINPAMFNSPPIPDVRVRYGDPDPVEKVVCEIIERAATFDLDDHTYMEQIKEVVAQANLTGWGVPVISYKPQLVKIDAGEVADGDTAPESNERIVSDKLSVECFPWDRFIIPEARSADKLPWMAFELDMSIDDIDDLCPPTKNPETGEIERRSDKLSGDKPGKKDGDTDPAPESGGLTNTLTVYKIWDKRSRRVLFITPKDEKFPLKEVEDPLQIDGFFPVPKILYAKRRRSSVQPISPWTIYKGLFQEFEEITQRINGLVSQIKVRGLYAKELEADFELLKNCKDGEYVPAKDVSQFTSNSRGLEAAIAHWPLKELMAALKEAVDHRERIKQLIYEITGVSDILRGATDPDETLGAQKIKASWGSQRIQDLQADVAEMCRETIRMMAEIRQRLTPWELLKEMTGTRFEPQMPEQPQLPPDADAQMQMQAQQQYQMAVQQAQEQAAAFEEQVKEAYASRSRRFRIDIETDSTIRADMSRDQEQMNLFMQVTGTFVQAAAGLVQIMPETRQAMFKLYAAQASKFKLGRQGEAALDELVEAAQHPPVQDGGQQVDPEQQAHEQQMAAIQQATEQSAHAHEQGMQEREQAHEQAMAQHDATTQQTTLAQIGMKDQANANQHARKVEAMQLQRALPPLGGAMQQAGGMN